MSSSRSSAFWAAFPRTSSRRSSRTISMASSTRSRTIDSTSRPTYPTSVNFDASTLRNGDCASRASRLAISVLPTPVGPIIRMFFGAISSASSGASFCRRIRLRKAIATARLAAVWPMTYLSSSATICRGVSDSVEVCVASGRKMAIYSSTVLKFFNNYLLVREDADLAGDGHRLLGDRARAEVGVRGQRLRRRERIRSARSDGDDAVVGLDQIAVAGQQE